MHERSVEIRRPGSSRQCVVARRFNALRHADWIIDLGPEGGSKGGKIVFEGTPAALAKHEKSITARYLRGE